MQLTTENIYCPLSPKVRKSSYKPRRASSKSRGKLRNGELCQVTDCGTKFSHDTTKLHLARKSPGTIKRPAKLRVQPTVASKQYNKEYLVPGTKNVVETYIANAPFECSTTDMEKFAATTTYASERSKLDIFDSKRGFQIKSASAGVVLSHAQQFGDTTIAVAERYSNGSLASSAITGIQVVDGVNKQLFNKVHSDHKKIFDMKVWFADPIKKEGIILSAVVCNMPQSKPTSSTDSEEQTGIFLIGSNIHNASFSKLLFSKLAPSHVNGRILLDVIESGRDAVVAFLVKDTAIAISHLKFSDSYYKEMKENTTVINTVQQKPLCTELDGYFIRDFSFGLQSCDGIVRLCVLLESPNHNKFACRIFELSTNLDSVVKMHTIRLSDPLNPSSFKRLVLNWDYDQLVLIGTSQCDQRYIYLNVALKSIGRFSKNKCIKMTQTPMLMACDGYKSDTEDYLSNTQKQINLSVKDLTVTTTFLKPDLSEDLSESTMIDDEETETLGKRVPRESEEPEAVSMDLDQNHELDGCTIMPEKKLKPPPKSKPVGPAPREVSMQQSLNRGNWGIAVTANKTDFIGQVTFGNIGVCTQWRNFKEPKADIDTRLDDSGFKSLEYVRQFDPIQNTWTTDGSVIMIQGVQNILTLKLNQIPESASNVVDSRSLAKVNVENFEEILNN
jgi:hypothetical protein